MDRADNVKRLKIFTFIYDLLVTYYLVFQRLRVIVLNEVRVYVALIHYCIHGQEYISSLSKHWI